MRTVFKYLAFASLALSMSCGNPFIDDEYAHFRGFEIHSLQWLPNDSGILARVAVPIAYSKYKYQFWLYDNEGNKISEIQDLVYAGGSFFPSSNPDNWVIEDNADVLVSNIKTGVVHATYTGSRLLSALPAEDRYLLYLYTENYPLGPYYTYKEIQINADHSISERRLRILNSTPYGGGFPLLLSNGRIAATEYDSLNARNLVIRDSLWNEKLRIPIDNYWSFRLATAPLKSEMLFVLDSRDDLFAINTITGTIDSILSLSAYAYDYEVSADGANIVYRKPDKLVIRDRSSGSEKYIDASSGVYYFALSNDGQKIAMIIDSDNGDDRLLVISLS